MRRTILTLALAAGGLLVAAGRADAQYPIQSTSFNPWVPYPNYRVTTVGGPFGGIGVQNYAVDPWTGTQMYQRNYLNPRTGWQGSYTYGYNPWVNEYRYQYNTFNPRLRAPVYGWPGYYGW